LAVEMRMKLGDWFRVVQLVKWGGGGGKNTKEIDPLPNFTSYY